MRGVLEPRQVQPMVGRNTEAPNSSFGPSPCRGEAILRRVDVSDTTT